MAMDDRHNPHQRNKREFLPTYRTEPIEGKRFNSTQIKEIIQDILNEKLSRVTYEPIMCKKLIAEIVEEIKEKVKLLNLSRFKIVTTAQIGSMGGQCVNIASRCVWADKTDNFASASFQSNQLFAVATVYGLYHE